MTEVFGGRDQCSHLLTLWFLLCKTNATHLMRLVAPTITSYQVVYVVRYSSTPMFEA